MEDLGKVTSQTSQTWPWAGASDLLLFFPSVPNAIAMESGIHATEAVLNPWAMTPLGMQIRHPAYQILTF